MKTRVDNGRMYETKNPGCPVARTVPWVRDKSVRSCLGYLKLQDYQGVIPIIVSAQRASLFLMSRDLTVETSATYQGTKMNQASGRT